MNERILLADECLELSRECLELSRECLELIHEQDGFDKPASDASKGSHPKGDRATVQG
ncbi:MAG: hypothetical protein HC773_18330 [Scytonema sp. CRU_2_7]|nr:hypothetical protein [Scytonema sp. CRU_2_7]